MALSVERNGVKYQMVDKASREGLHTASLNAKNTDSTNGELDSIAFSDGVNFLNASDLGVDRIMTNGDRAMGDDNYVYFQDGNVQKAKDDSIPDGQGNGRIRAAT